MVQVPNLQASFPDGYYQGLLQIAESAEMEDNPNIISIKKDLSRTFHIQVEEGVETMRKVLLAYSMHNPDVGYCQSLNFLSAALLLYLEEQDAFWVLMYIVEGLTFMSNDRLWCGVNKKHYVFRPMTHTDWLNKGDEVFYYQTRVDTMTISMLLTEKLPKVVQALTRLQV